jgi:hypothetical protein
MAGWLEDVKANVRKVSQPGGVAHYFGAESQSSQVVEDLRFNCHY